ncbi:MAG TPA: MBL fold metallo-hydrolase [Deltaproteobacteria bacterium]|nr:MBL fold metallo-hydrolase [Deltaproteobacteria bacterium]HPJ94827.1 MBL fold metallo-hydrolase [Deltaproteobacteria bacterium]HPR52691.1 MBL fold metallo-hydrolase [Deltaproteobacteria bacterium]
MALKITTLIEDTPGEHKALLYEHGLSFFIEKDNFRMLFDTGQSAAYLSNAHELNIDLGRIDCVALSHGHYDHSGGFRALTEITTDFTLFTGQGFFDEKYGVSGQTSEFLGNNFDESFLSGKGIDHQYVHERIREISPGVFLLSDFPRIHEDEMINQRFLVLRNGTFHQDLFEDEIAIAIDTPKGLVVILGCAHPGMKNMLDSAVELLGKPVYAVLGGTHLVEARGNNLELSLTYLKNETIKVIGVSHCTGQEALGRLAGSNDRYQRNGTGSSLFIV